MNANNEKTCINEEPTADTLDKTHHAWQNKRERGEEMNCMGHGEKKSEKHKRGRRKKEGERKRNWKTLTREKKKPVDEMNATVPAKGQYRRNTVLTKNAHAPDTWRTLAHVLPLTGTPVSGRQNTCPAKIMDRSYATRQAVKKHLMQNTISKQATKRFEDPDKTAGLRI